MSVCSRQGGLKVYLTSQVSLLPTCCLFAGQHGHGHHGSDTTGKHQKGADYDATGGVVDDRSTLQKLKDKLTPGSDVGKHTKQ